ncbi:MAG TPA: malate synthase A [bacterium]
MKTSAATRRSTWLELGQGVEIPAAAWTQDAQAVLTPDAIAFLADLHRRFETERQSLLAGRMSRQAQWDKGEVPAYEDRSSEAATGTWKVAPIPQDMLCRRVEITGPVSSAKMVINMLSRGTDGARADTAMLDFEDALKPSWDNLMAGQRNVLGAAKRTLEHNEPAANGKPGKLYRLNADDMAKVIVRPRGLHLDESNLLVDGKPISGSLLDTALNFFHCGLIWVRRGETPAYYIPKAEHWREAGWWSAVFEWMENKLNIKVGTIKATFLIETLPAAFHMEEILYAARKHAVGLNVGRWDKIFSDIKTLRMHKDRVVADRAAITMKQPWMANYAKRCVQICHQRGAFGMGGMAAFTPGQSQEVRDAQVAKVLEDKRLEAEQGHDGCWVSHPFFIGTAMKAFPRTNQLDVKHEGVDKYPDLLPQAGGPKTIGGLRTNVRVGIAYLEGWQRDIGCVAWDNLMEDLATLEISRAQTWQWMHHKAALEDGSTVNEALVRKVFKDELTKIIEQESADIAKSRGTSHQDVVRSFTRAAQEAETVFTRNDLTEFLYTASEPVSG